MKKVVTINLNGRAYQVEEAGYEALQDYLSKAEKTLVKNQDKTEILADIEQAIADKCTGELKTGKNVIATETVRAVLEKIGPVQEGSTDEDEPGESGAGVESARKLYRLPKEGQLAGVCAGLAAYFGTDTTIMRVIFVVLLFISQGFMILIYLALAVAMPEAKKPEQVAEAYGKPGTAKEIVGRVKDIATDKDNVAKIGTVITVVGRAIAQILKFAAAVIFGAFTLAWVWVLGAIGLEGLQFKDELASLNGFKQMVFVTAVYIVVAVPFFLLVRALDRATREGAKDELKNTAEFDGTMIALIVTATVVLSAFFSVYATSVNDYVTTHGGYLDFGRHHLCVDEAKCGSGIEYLRAHPQYWDENPQIDRRLLQN